MAIASRWARHSYNRPDFAIFDYRVYVICSDGDLMEGIGSEAARSRAICGSRTCAKFTTNTVTIEGYTDLAFSEDVAARFGGYGWNVLRSVMPTILSGRAKRCAPSGERWITLVIVNSVIGYGAPHK